MTIREPTPWGSYAAFGIMISIMIVLNDRFDFNVYGWLEWVIQTIKPQWWAATIGILASLALYVGLLLTFRHLRRYKWYRTKFRNRTMLGESTTMTIMLFAIYFTFGTLYSTFILIRQLFA